MTDIVERLRVPSANHRADILIRREAADEIERLRGVLQKVRVLQHSDDHEDCVVCDTIREVFDD